MQELKELFWQEAEKYKVLPLLATLSTFFGILPPIDRARRRSSSGRSTPDIIHGPWQFGIFQNDFAGSHAPVPGLPADASEPNNGYSTAMRRARLLRRSAARV